MPLKKIKDLKKPFGSKLHMNSNKPVKKILILSLFLSSAGAQNTPVPSVIITRVKYHGGGDWYNDPSAVPNLARFIKQNVKLDIAENEAQTALTDESLFAYPILFLTGHGQMTLSRSESDRLRTYLLRGGFLYVDDDYGLDSDFRKALAQVFPDRPLQEIPFDHPIYKIPYRFENGPPKIHEHDNKPARGYGVFDDYGRLMIYYTYESNISDGWVDPQVYKDPPEKREAALKMGTNIILYALMH
jgi:hypothetical protein